MKVAAFCIISLFFFLFILPSPSFAATFFDTTPPSGPNYSVVSAEFCGGPSECANSQNPGNCGLPACTGGSAWTKYELTCVKYQPPFADASYDSYYQQGAIVYSIGDKCFLPEPGLRSSSCFGNPSPSIYKTCCTNTTPSYVISDPDSGMTTNSCQEYAVDTINPPWEGRCPGGSQPVRCGDSGFPPCGQQACGVIPEEPPPEPEPEPAPTIEQPTLITFTGSSDTNFCSPYTATLTWEQTDTPLPQGVSCANGFWVDIDNNSNWSDGFYHKCVSGNFTQAADGFTWHNNNNTLTFQGGTTYRARVYNGAHSNTKNLTTPSSGCPTTSASCSITCNRISEQSTTCTFNTSYSIGVTAQSTYQQKLTPDVNASTQTGWQPNSQELSWTYQPGTTYVAKLEARKDDGSPPQTSCTSPPFRIIEPPTACSVAVDPISRISASGPYQSGRINWNTSTGFGASRVWFNSGTCSSLSPTSCPTAGWTQIPQAITRAEDPPGDHTKNWDPNRFCPAAGGTTHAVGVTDANDLLRCVTNNVTCPPPGLVPCTMAADSPSGPTPHSVNLTVGLNTTGMPATKQSKWDLGDGSSEIINNSLSQSHTYTLQASETNPRTFTPKFQAVDSATGQPLSEVCSTPVTVNPLGVTCPPEGCVTCSAEANQQCNASGNLTCAPSFTQGSTQNITQAQHNFCKRIQSSNTSLCIYCPPPPPPPGPTCLNADPPNNIPSVKLMPDGKTVEVSYTLQDTGRDDDGGDAFLPQTSPFAFLNHLFTPRQADASHLPVYLFRSNQRGFTGGSGAEFRGNQFGSHGVYFDPTGGSSRLYYYQVESSTGGPSVYSNTVAVKTTEERSRSGRCEVDRNVSLVSVSDIEQFATTFKFKLKYDASLYFSPFGGTRGCNSRECNPDGPPPYLKITGSSLGTMYVPWVRGTGGGCDGGFTRIFGSNICQSTRYTAQYEIALPPGTSDTFTNIRGYAADGCPRGLPALNVSFDAGTITASSAAPSPRPVVISAFAGRDARGRDPFVTLTWQETNPGQINKIYRSETRWAGTTQLGVPTVVNEFGSISYRAYDDLENQPPGTYYYGAEVSRSGNRQFCQSVFTDQVGFRWRGFTKPWIQTTGGDVHSNVKINTPGGR